MAEEQNLPNEEDVKKPEAGVKEVEQKASDVEIEIEDDTPEPDQNRKNLPKELVERLDSDELTEYDDKVKDKIYQNLLGTTYYVRCLMPKKSMIVV